MKKIILSEAKMNQLIVQISDQLMARFQFPAGVIRGSEVLKFSDQKQVNNYIMFQVYQDWNAQAGRFTHPWFDFTEPEVQDALRRFMNVVSKFVRIKRDDFRPLVEKAVYNTLRLILDPEEAFLKFFFLSNDRIPVSAYKKHAPYFADFDFAIQAIQRYLEKNEVKVLERDLFFEKFRKVVQIFEQKEGKSIQTYQSFLFKRLTGKDLSEVLESRETVAPPPQPQSRFNRQPGPQPEAQTPSAREQMERKTPIMPTPKIEPTPVPPVVQPTPKVEQTPPVVPKVEQPQMPPVTPVVPKVEQPVAPPVIPTPPVVMEQPQPIAEPEPIAEPVEEEVLPQLEEIVPEAEETPMVAEIETEEIASVLPEEDAFEKASDEPTLTVDFDIEVPVQEDLAEGTEPDALPEEIDSPETVQTEMVAEEAPVDPIPVPAVEMEAEIEAVEAELDMAEEVVAAEMEVSEPEAEAGDSDFEFSLDDASADASAWEEDEEESAEAETEEEDDVWVPQPEEMWEPEGEDKSSPAVEEAPEKETVQPFVAPEIPVAKTPTTLFPQDTDEGDKPMTLSQKFANQGGEKKPALHELLAGKREKSVLEVSMEKKQIDTPPVNQPPVTPQVPITPVAPVTPTPPPAPEPPKEEVKQPISQPEPPAKQEEPVSEPMAFDLFEKDETTTINQAKEAGTTLADRFKESNTSSLNDQMKKMQSIELEQIPVHKQFQFVQKLFGGSTVKFKVVLDKVNDTTNRAQAEDLLEKYVFNNPDVNADTKIAQEFRDLVNRRFGN